MLNRRNLLEHLAAASLVSQAGASVAAPAPAPAPQPVPQLREAAPSIVLSAGQHAVTTNMTVRADILVMPGATISVAAGKTLKLLGDFQAPIGLVFTGPGTVDLNSSRAAAAYPEWWGAGPNNGGVDSLLALNACIAAHPVTLLGASDYFISSTLAVERSHCRIWGAGNRGGLPGQGTRLIVTNAASDVVRLGPLQKPGSVNEFVQNVDLRWFEATRSVPPQGEATGVRLSHVLHCQVEGVSASQHANGFSAAGAVRTYLRDCIAFRSVVGTPVFRGFYLDGRRDIGLAGGNGSIFLIDCNVSTGGDPKLRESIGALLEGGFADSFLHRFETAAVAVGIRVDGAVDKLSAGQKRSGQGNLHIVSPILDGFAFAGIELTGGGAYALVDIVDVYCGLAPESFAGIYVHGWRGLISVTGGQILGWYNARAGGNGLGIHAEQSEGLGLHGLKLLGCKRPISLDRCRDLDIDVAITNPDEPATSAALWLDSCQRGTVRARVKGGRDAFHQGIYLRGTNRALSIDCMGIDPACLRAGGERRLVTDGAPTALRSNGISVTGL